MSARLMIVCLVAVAAAVTTVVPCSETASAACEAVSTAGAKPALESAGQAESEITDQATDETVDAPITRSARLIVETGVDIQTFGSMGYTRLVAHEHVVGSRHRLSLILRHSDSIEWGMTAVHLPSPGVTTLGASARFRMRPEVSATIDISGSLVANSLSRGVVPGFGWGTNLEWHKVIDPLALTAKIGYASHSTSDFGLASVGGSVSLLVNDYVSVSGSGSFGWSGTGAVITQVGASVAYRRSGADTVYVTVLTSLSPSDSFVATLGVSHELR